MNIHNEMILAEYDALLPIYRRLERIVEISLQNIIDNNGLTVTAVSARVKSRESLAGKLALKGDKYHSLGDITDILGARVITFYTDDVDRIAALTEKLFDIDWENSVDKRRLHDTDSFGYNSLHYICRLPKSIVNEPDCPQLNEISFELQPRHRLQDGCGDTALLYAPNQPFGRYVGDGR